MQLATDVYQQRWYKAFTLMLSSKPNKIIMVAVGAGAFDPTEDQCFTRACAKGFAQALNQAYNTRMSMLDEIISIPNLKITFPFRDGKNKESIFGIFKKEILAITPDKLHGCFEFHEKPSLRCRN
jgi:hypothetical protein